MNIKRTYRFKPLTNKKFVLRIKWGFGIIDEFASLKEAIASLRRREKEDREEDGKISDYEILEVEE